MQIKYYPRCSDTTETSIVKKDEETIVIDGEEFTFPRQFQQFPTVATLTKGAIMSACYENGELYLEVLFKYKGTAEPSCVKPSFTRL